MVLDGSKWIPRLQLVDLLETDPTFDLESCLAQAGLLPSELGEDGYSCCEPPSLPPLGRVPPAIAVVVRRLLEDWVKGAYQDLLAAQGPGPSEIKAQFLVFQEHGLLSEDYTTQPDGDWLTVGSTAYLWRFCDSVCDTETEGDSVRRFARSLVNGSGDWPEPMGEQRRSSEFRSRLEAYLVEALKALGADSCRPVVELRFPPRSAENRVLLNGQPLSLSEARYTFLRRLAFNHAERPGEPLRTMSRERARLSELRTLNGLPRDLKKALEALPASLVAPQGQRARFNPELRVEVFFED